MAAKMIYTDMIMNTSNKLVLNDNNSADIVKQGIEAMSINDFSKILCDKIHELKLIDSETYNTLIKLYNCDYTTIFLQILASKK